MSSCEPGSDCCEDLSAGQQTMWRLQLLYDFISLISGAESGRQGKWWQSVNTTAGWWHRILFAALSFGFCWCCTLLKHIVFIWFILGCTKPNLMFNCRTYSTLNLIFKCLHAQAASLLTECICYKTPAPCIFMDVFVIFLMYLCMYFTFLTILFVYPSS